VLLADGRRLPYDYLVIATGVAPRPDQTPGMLDGGQWRRSIFDFYTYDGAVALADALRRFDGGRLVVHIVDMPIKCPVAPLEFAFLADVWFQQRGMRDRVELVYSTPLPGAFTKPIASRRLGAMLDERKIAVETDFLVERIDNRTLVSYDEREIPFLQHIAGKPMTRPVRRTRQLLRGVRARQGPAHRLQLRHRTADRPLPDPRPRPVQSPEGDPGQPLGQARIPLDLLEPPAARATHPAAGTHVDGRQTR
jgi:NADPH-dependent 2,4-dienoyl-CoA reductase/sulfur reductase-like enzyme